MQRLSQPIYCTAKTTNIH